VKQSDYQTDNLAETGCTSWFLKEASVIRLMSNRCDRWGAGTQTSPRKEDHNNLQFRGKNTQNHRQPMHDYDTPRTSSGGDSK